MDARPWTVVYVSPNGSRGNFIKATKAEAMAKILDLTFSPHKVLINQVAERVYHVTSVRNTLLDF